MQLGCVDTLTIVVDWQRNALARSVGLRHTVYLMRSSRFEDRCLVAHDTANRELRHVGLCVDARSSRLGESERPVCNSAAVVQLADFSLDRKAALAVQFFIVAL